jgi:hypothetical protein
MSTWTFSCIPDNARRSRLETAPAFEDIANRVANSLRIVCTHPDFCSEATGYTRLVCCVSVEVELFDVFFNSASGYRGRYFISPDQGLRANSYLVRLVSPALLAHTAHANLPFHQAEQSLSARSAKCWLAEVGKSFCSACDGEWSAPQDSTPEILNGRWEYGDHPNARYGRKAPRFTKLKFLGGFVDPSGNEYVTGRKRDRSAQIFEFGWS